jgi:hypothetical protein
MGNPTLFSLGQDIFPSPGVITFILGPNIIVFAPVLRMVSDRRFKSKK